jgi:3-methylcrotonyl-CoA carboxylase beta subunit
MLLVPLVLLLCDSAGGELTLQSDLFPDKYMAGRIFRNQSLLSKRGIKQVALVFGHCTAGGAYVPALSDYSVIVRGTGAVFLGGPPLVKAATGEIITADALGGCDLHTGVSGVCDYPANDERHAIAIGRDIVAQWDKPHTYPDARGQCRSAALRSARALRGAAARHQIGLRHARGDCADRRWQPVS